MNPLPMILIVVGMIPPVAGLAPSAPPGVVEEAGITAADRPFFGRSIQPIV
jgi:hypothetical protein